MLKTPKFREQIVFSFKIQFMIWKYFKPLNYSKYYVNYYVTEQQIEINWSKFN